MRADEAQRAIQAARSSAASLGLSARDDFETCCRGPIEFDLAHAPREVADHYPGVDHELLRDCRALALAMITAWRWDRDDQFPDGPRLGIEWLADLRAATARPG